MFFLATALFVGLKKQNDKGDGVFIKAIDKGEDVPDTFTNSESIRDAVPDSGRFTILETKDSSSSSFLSC